MSAFWLNLGRNEHSVRHADLISLLQLRYPIF